MGGAGGFGGFDMGGMAFMSQANYNQKGEAWERPANIEIFDGGKSVVSQDVGIRTKGAASRAWPQKSFNIFARMDYGKAEVEYDLFEGKSTKEKNNKVIDTFDGFTIRNGGNDNMAGFFRDSVNQSLVFSARAWLCTGDFQSAVCFFSLLQQLRRYSVPQRR